jgi:hypothetical protein
MSDKSIAATNILIKTISMIKFLTGTNLLHFGVKHPFEFGKVLPLHKILNIPILKHIKEQTSAHCNEDKDDKK